MNKSTTNSLGIKYTQPDFINRNLGTIKKRIGDNGTIEIEMWKGNIVILKLTR